MAASCLSRLCANLVDQVLRGEHPKELPVELPSRFHRRSWRCAVLSDLWSRRVPAFPVDENRMLVRNGCPRVPGLDARGGPVDERLDQEVGVSSALEVIPTV